ncbi:helix-turn-helix domain-containing protein [Mycolicibacterium septicum]|uniref:Helix-turn-helix domain-containing protein n=1 Tax=Mycolicibacterium septicum TaxID=98668 RepID=A0ABW9LRE1_9MYCO
MRRMGYKEAAEIAGVSVRKMRYLVEAGEVVARRCGSRVLIAERDLEEWLDSLPYVVDTKSDDPDDGADVDETDTDTAGVDRPRREGATRAHAGSATDVRQQVAA